MAMNSRGPGLWKWVALPLIWMAAAAAALALATWSRAWLPVLWGGLAALLWLLWILWAALSPARADRRCPRCGRPALLPLERGNPLGVRCGSCGHLDREAHVPHLEEE
jgi:hypothetical protein